MTPEQQSEYRETKKRLRITMKDELKATKKKKKEKKANKDEVSNSNGADKTEAE